MCKSSEQINELATALAKAQGQIEHAKKDTANPFFKTKYADLAACLDAAKKALSENGLSYVQCTTPNAEGIQLTTRLMHSSGQWIESDIFMPVVKKDPQGFGSALTYARRYSFCAIVGIAQDDDDGNAASQQKQPQPQPQAKQMQKIGAEMIDSYIAELIKTPSFTDNGIKQQMQQWGQAWASPEIEKQFFEKWHSAQKAEIERRKAQPVAGMQDYPN